MAESLWIESLVKRLIESHEIFHILFPVLQQNDYMPARQTRGYLHHVAGTWPTRERIALSPGWAQFSLYHFRYWSSLLFHSFEERPALLTKEPIEQARQTPVRNTEQAWLEWKHFSEFSEWIEGAYLLRCW